MLPEAFRTRRYLSVTEVAEVLDVPKRTVQHWCSVGVITAVRASPKGTWRIPLAAIREQFAAQAEDLDDCRLSATCASCARDDTGYRAAR